MKHRQSGYTIAVVAALLIAGAGLTAYTLRNEAATVTTTQQGDMVAKLNTLFTAIVNFERVKGVYPCPASLNISLDNTASAFGTSADCSLVTAPAGITDITGSVWRGMVPTETLGLPREMAVDNWGNKIQYAVHKNLTKGGAHIEIRNSSDVKVGDYDFTLISTGSDERGAWSAYSDTENADCGASANSLITTEKRFENCDLDRIFLDQPLLTSSSAQANTYYDDTVYYFDRNAPIVCLGTDTINWNVGGNTCTGTAGANGTFGDAGVVINDVAPVDTGSVTITCQADSTWATSGPTCSAPSGSGGCNVGDTELFVSGFCDDGGAGEGTQETACTGAGGDYWASYPDGQSCNGGLDAVNAFHCCQTAAVATCAAGETINWSQGGDNCTADSGTLGTFGDASKVITDSTGSETGTVTIVCQADGTWASSSPSCSAAANCSAPWIDGGTGGGSIEYGNYAGGYADEDDECNEICTDAGYSSYDIYYDPCDASGCDVGCCCQ